jgi:hypothetical protein
LRHALDTIWSEQEDRAETSTRNSGVQAAGCFPLICLWRGTTSRKALANTDLKSLRGRSNRKAMKVLSRDILSFQSKTTSFSYFGREGSNPWESGQVKGGIKSYQRPTGWGSKLRNWLASAWPSRRQRVFVKLSQPDVLREFPALPIELKLPSTETAGPDGGSAQRNRGERGDTDPGGGREICPEGRRNRGSKKKSPGPQSFGRVKHNRT